MNPKNKNLLIISLIAIALVTAGYFVVKSRTISPVPAASEKPSLPINAIPIEERPFVILTPDSSGRNLTLLIDQAKLIDIYEYELVYEAGDKQEGAFGRIDLSEEDMPVEKSLLLGSKSAGGAVSYHEDVTGGSLTLTYDQVKLKESFNFLRFSSGVADYTSVDGRFTATFLPTALPSNSVVVIMKSFGLPGPVEGTLRAGPYSLLTATSPKGEFDISISLSAGEYTNPTIMEWDGDKWIALETDFDESVVSSTSESGSVFVVTSD